MNRLAAILFPPVAAAALMLTLLGIAVSATPVHADQPLILNADPCEDIGCDPNHPCPDATCDEPTNLNCSNDCGLVFNPAGYTCGCLTEE